jgi:hypothetical protein
VRKVRWTGRSSHRDLQAALTPRDSSAKAAAAHEGEPHGKQDPIRSKAMPTKPPVRSSRASVKLLATTGCVQKALRSEAKGDAQKAVGNAKGAIKDVADKAHRKL